MMNSNESVAGRYSGSGFMPVPHAIRTTEALIAASWLSPSPCVSAFHAALTQQDYT